MKAVTLTSLGLEDYKPETIEDEISKRATNFARYAMADVEYALQVLGMKMDAEQYEQAFRAMMVRKAKNEVRKYNAG